MFPKRRSSRTNANDRLPRASLGRVEGVDGFAEGRSRRTKPRDELGRFVRSSDPAALKERPAPAVLPPEPWYLPSAADGDAKADRFSPLSRGFPNDRRLP